MHAVKRRPRPARLGFRLVALVVALVAVGSACSRSSYVFVSSSDHQAYFKVPGTWHYYDKTHMLVAMGLSLSPESKSENRFLVGFDADPAADINHIFDLAAAPTYPVVFAQVVSLPFVLRDPMSLETMRNIYYPVDRLLQNNQAEILSYNDVVVKGGFHGAHLVYNVIPGGASSIRAGNSVIRVDQTTVVDPSTKVMYLFVVRCEAHTYRDNKALIDAITQSWTVKER
jgi:hypothetical protein